MDTLCRLMYPDQSQLIEPLSLARAGEHLNGQVCLKELQRLQTMLHDDRGELIYNLDFSIDANGLYRIGGEIGASVGMLCQRCLEPMRVEITQSVCLGIVRDMMEANNLSPEYEPLMLVEETFSLFELVENELILALPFSPMHPPGDCAGGQILEKLNNNQRQNPFAKLAEFKQHKHLK